MPELCQPSEGVRSRVLRLLLRLAAASLLLFGVAGCGAGAGTQFAQMRIVHASSHAGTVDVLSKSSGNAVGVAYNLSFGTVTTYFPATPSAYVVASTDTHTTLAEVRPNAAAAKHSTLLLQDTSAGVQPMMLVDQDQPASAGHALLRFVNQLQDSGAVDLYLVPLEKIENRTVLAAGDLAASNSSGYIDITSGSYMLYIMPAGVPFHAASPLYIGAAVSYSSGTARTLVLLSQIASQQPVNVLTLSDVEPLPLLPR